MAMVTIIVFPATDGIAPGHMPLAKPMLAG
jgi:hypothetical protein